MPRVGSAVCRPVVDAGWRLLGVVPARAQGRLPWLWLGLAGSTLATLVMSCLAAAFERQPAWVLRAPGLVYQADALGNQTEAVAVRGLSLVRFARLHLGELRTRLSIGLILAGLTLPAVWRALGKLRLALAVAGAQVAGLPASGVGLMLPWLLYGSRVILPMAAAAGHGAAGRMDAFDLFSFVFTLC